ncbi:MAG: hypothetical protein ACKVKF_21965 [Rhodobacterales bacterium]
MTVLTWPTELPRPERNSWNASWQDPRQNRRGETGGPRYRRRFSAVSKMVSLSVLLSRAEKGIFDRFLKQDTDFGSRLFWMPDPTTDGWALLDEAFAPLLDEAGGPLLMSAQWLCVFGDDFAKETIVGTDFRMTFSVVVLP